VLLLHVINSFFIMIAYIAGKEKKNLDKYIGRRYNENTI